MFSVLFGIFTRILSNSYLNVFQKILTEQNKPSVINFYTYLGLTIPGLCFFNYLNINISNSLIMNFILMGFLGALGNYYIIKALSLGELSSLAPINSYKPIVAMIIAFIYLKEVPALSAIFGIILIITGTLILNYKTGFSNPKAVFYRILALIFSGTEAVFIKKIIILTNVPASFVLWVLSGFLFSMLFVVFSSNKLKVPPLKYMLLLIISVALMQYSTNFVFSKINVSCALALFQLSTLLCVFLGVNIFNERGLVKKLTASFIMVVGAVVIILS